MMSDPEEVLRTTRVFALIGATQDILKYSNELLFTLVEHGYTVYPINPRYETIENQRCYPSLVHLPEQPDVVIVVLAPHIDEQVLHQIVERKIPTVWLPPGSWSDQTVAKAQSAGLDVLYNVCPIGTLRTMQQDASS